MKDFFIFWIVTLTIKILAFNSIAGAAHTETLVDEYQLTKPYTNKNMSVRLILGPDAMKDRTFLTLEEALDRKVVVLSETSNVNQLRITNKSKKHYVFVQSGDIVKGGKQDRVISLDMVLPPASGAIPIDSFCVEQGRWAKRGNESVAEFSSSKDMVNTKALKIAAKARRDQSQVWKEVKESQDLMERRLGKSVRVARSATSLQLSLEDKELKKLTEAYFKSVGRVIDAHPDAVGMVFAVNGKLNSIDMYGSQHLFKKLWPKLITSAIREAITEKSNRETFKPPSAKAIRSLLLNAKQASPAKRRLPGNIEFITREGETAYQFETRDKGAAPSSMPIHMNYVTK